MPPKRSSTKAAQGTISFHNRVTKPCAASALKDSKARISSPLTKSVVQNEIAQHENSSSTIKKVVREIKKEQPIEELEALKISDAQIRRYWNAREAERKAPRIHQEDLNIEEKILRLFDMSSTYGPCIGMNRTRRWYRANKLGLSPPIEVLAVLIKERSKENAKIERAHMDDLLNSRPKLES